MIRIIGAALGALILFSTSAAHADTDRLGLVFKSLVSGRDMPAVVIQPREAVRSIQIKLKSKRGQAQTLRAVNVPAGKQRELKVRQREGKFAYQGHFSVKWASGPPSDFDMAFELTRVGKLKLKLAPQDVDLDTRTIRFTVNNPLQRAELTIMGQSGKQLAQVSQKYSAADAGSPLTFQWREPGGDVLYMDFKVYDVAGFWKGVRLTPFAIEIPHDDVEFESAKWDIGPQEAPKLKKTLRLIREALAKHGTLLQLKLFVAGYTDTVGSTAANQSLSNNRARSIGAWFRQNGLKIPIYYQGFGEKVLAKPTPDETDEPLNRRAVYILSSQQPAVSETIPHQRWTRL